jgi:hypothetical protein
MTFFMNGPASRNRVIELANDAVEAEGLQIGDALADLLERADQPELKTCVRIHHLLLAERGPGRGTGSADYLTEEIDRLRIGAARRRISSVAGPVSPASVAMT